MKPKTDAPSKKLLELAYGCEVGICNLRALTASLVEALDETPQWSLQEGASQADMRPALQMVAGQISYLSGASLGPDADTLNEWQLLKERYME